MTMGGVLIKNDYLDDYRKILRELADLFGKPSLHCSKLSHNEICYFAKKLNELDLVIFGVVSLKTTLGTYRGTIKSNAKLYYNKCAHYILERVGMCFEEMGLTEDELSVCFEEGNFDYNKLRGLISKCRSNPMRPNTKFLKHVNSNAITAKEKSSEALLQFGDLVAHALFRCVDDGPRTFGITETRYVDEMRDRFWRSGAKTKAIGQGLYCVHKVADVGANPTVERFFREL